MRASVALLLAASLRGARGLAAPRKKLPTRRVDIKCTGCKAPLFRYAKGNGAGSQAGEDLRRTDRQGLYRGPAALPAVRRAVRPRALVHGRLAYKVINGKVSMK